MAKLFRSSLICGLMQPFPKSAARTHRAVRFDARIRNAASGLLHVHFCNTANTAPSRTRALDVDATSYDGKKKKCHVAGDFAAYEKLSPTGGERLECRQHASCVAISTCVQPVSGGVKPVVVMVVVR